MNLDHDFVQMSKLSEDQKKGLHQKWNTFFPRIQVDTYAQMHTSVKLLGGCKCRPYSNYWGDTVKLLEGVIPPGFRHPWPKLLWGYSRIIGRGYPPPPGFGTPGPNYETLKLYWSSESIGVYSILRTYFILYK